MGESFIKQEDDGDISAKVYGTPRKSLRSRPNKADIDHVSFDGCTYVYGVDMLALFTNSQQGSSGIFSDGALEVFEIRALR